MEKKTIITHTMQLQCLSLLLGLLLSLDAARGTAAQQQRAPVELSSSAILFYDCEYEPHYGQPISQCDLLLANAKRGGSRAVNLVPTHYWWAASMAKFTPDVCYPDNWALNTTVDYYCSKWEWDAPCAPFTAATVARFAKGIKDCIQKAHDMFDEVLVSPHLDDASKTMHWRNMLWFDPLAKDSKGFTYWDIMLNPILEAVKAVYTKPGKAFTFGLQGEMGATVFFFPASYLKVVDRIRSEYKGPAKLDVALMFNHAYLPGVVNRLPDPANMRAGPPGTPMYPFQGWGQLAPLDAWPSAARLKATLPQLRALLDAVDVLGVSCYPRTGATPKPEEIESCAAKYDAELKALGFDLNKWAASGTGGSGSGSGTSSNSTSGSGSGGKSSSSSSKKRLILSEIGLGGGVSRCGNEPAKTRADAGKWTMHGAPYPWAAATDPWQRPEVRAYRREWHAALLKLLRAGGRAYPLGGAFYWNLVSFDFAAVHPAVASNNGTYADDTIAAAVRAHNAAINPGGGGGGANSGTGSAR